MTGTKKKSTVVGKVKVSRITVSPAASAAHVAMSQHEAIALCGAIAQAASSGGRLILTVFGGNGRNTMYARKSRKA
jgi:hypothetical protein